MPNETDRRSPGPGPSPRRPERRTWLLLALILAVAAALRISYLIELRAQPDFASPTADAAFHDYWARGLLSGDWTPPAGMPNPHISDRPFMRPPGYPYFLALLELLSGRSYVGVRVWQLLIGLGSLFLLFLLTRRLFGDAAGLVAAALGTLYWGFLFYEGELQAPVLLIPLLLGVFLCLHAWLVRPSPAKLLAVGLLLGLAAIERANLLLFLPVGAAAIWWLERRRGRPRGWRSAALFLGGMLVAVVPVTVRNLSKGDFVIVSTNGPINLFLGNHDAADGHSLRVPGLFELSGQNSWSMFAYDDIAQGVARRVGRPLKHSEVAAWFQDRAMEWIRAHPADFARLTLRRAALFFGPHEVSNNKAGEFEKAASRTLRFLLPFSVLLSLGLFGGGMLWFDRRRSAAGSGRVEGAADAASGRCRPETWTTLAALGLFVLLYFLSFLPFIVADRFRVPLVPLLIVPGAWGILRVAAMFRARRPGAAAIGIAVWGAVLGLASVSWAEYKPEKAWWHTDRGLAYQRTGRLEEATREFYAAIKANPGFVDGRLALGGALAQAERFGEAITQFQMVAQARPDRVDVRLQLADMLIAQNRLEEAATELTALAREHPESPDAQRLLGRTLLSLGRRGEALAALKTAASALPSGFDECNALGNDLKEAGALREAEAAFRHAQEIDPSRVEPVINLGGVRFREGRLDEAIQFYRQAVGMAPSSVVARVNLGGALFTKGDRAGAEAELREVLRLDPQYEPALRLRALLAGSGGARPAAPR